MECSVNCVDRHAAANPDKVALIWEKDEPGQDVKVTYSQLLQMVSRIANVFKSRGIGRYDHYLNFPDYCFFGEKLLWRSEMAPKFYL